MKFYDCQTAPSPRRVRIFIAEKGLEIPTVEVNLRNQEQLTPEFLKINPDATVPVIQLDDGTCFTSTAGCRAYLENLHPDPALLGADAAERGRVADLVSKIEGNGLMAVAEALRNSAKGMKNRAITGPHNYEQIPALAERGRQRIERFFPVLEALLANKAYLAGDRFTAADIDAFLFTEFVQWVKVSVPDSPNLTRWRASVRSRPSMQV